MINLYDKETNKLLGPISEAQLQFLKDEMEEESAQDQDYYLNRDFIELLAAKGADQALLNMLRNALGEREEMEIRWSATSLD